MRLILLTISIILTIFNGHLSAQNGVGIGNNNPQELLDVSGAIKIGSTAIGSSDPGSIIWNGSRFRGYTGSTWVNLDESPGSIPTATSNTAYLGSSSQNIISSSWVDIISINLPSAGRYLITTELRLTAGSSGHGHFRLAYSSGSEINNSDFEAGAWGANVKFVGKWHQLLYVSSSTTVKLQGRRLTNTLLQIQNDSNGRSKLSYIKLHD